MRPYLLVLLLSSALRAQVVISQIYGGGGNTGASFRNDFVELFNRGSQPQSLDGWTIQYAGATATAFQATPLTGTLQAGQYYLIQQSAGAGGTVNLPAPDATGTAAMSSSAGKVVLRDGANNAVDRVGYGFGANEFEGAPTRDLSNTTAAVRARNGCQDTDDNSLDFAIGAPAPRNRSTATVDCTTPQETLRLTISEIQGPGAESPYVGRRVVTTGVVTYRRTNGFYLQMPDSDPNASSGILVFTQSMPPAVAQPGAALEVEADVVEFRPAADPRSAPLTELINPILTLRAQNQTLPTPVQLTADQDFERYEGMLVRSRLNIVAPTNGTTAWGTIDAPRPFRRTDEAAWPNLIRIITSAPLAAGLTLEAVTGPLDFGSRTYTIYAEPLAGSFSGQPLGAAAPARTDYEFTVGTLNVQRLFDEAALPARLVLLRNYVERQLGLPDVLVIQEVENLSVLERAADAIGSDYLAFTAPSNDPSGITSGFLVRASRVAVDSVEQLGKDDQFEPGQLTHDRPPVLLRARVGNQPFALLGVHMRSRINLEDPRVLAKRQAQFRSIRNELAKLPSDILVLAAGDWNSFAEEVSFPAFTNLTTRLTAAENYSYVFEGKTQTLDHIVVNSTSLPLLSRIYFGRGNADSPSTARLSDHDGVVAYFLTRPVPFTAAGIVDSASFLTGALAPNTFFTIFGTDSISLPNEPPANADLRVLINGVASTAVYAGRNQIVAVSPATLPLGFTTVAVQRAGSTIHSVEVPTALANPSLPIRFQTSDQIPFGSWRPGGAYEVVLNGVGNVIPLPVINARLCRLPATVLKTTQYPGSIPFLSIEIQVPLACPAGPQPIEISIGSRTTQSGLTTLILP